MQCDVRSMCSQLEQGNTLSHLAFNLLHSEQLFAPLPGLLAFFPLAASFPFPVTSCKGGDSSRLSRRWRT